MDQTREARRSTTTSMAAPNGVTRLRQRSSEKKERDPESLNRSKRRRSGRFAQTNDRDVEDDSSGETLGDDDVQHIYHRKSFPSGRISRHAASLKVADEMIGVAVPRKARSAYIKRSHDCRTSSGSGGGVFEEDRRRHQTSPGSYSFEVVSPSSSTVAVKQKKNVSGSKSKIPKPPKSFGTIEDDLEIEIAEVLSGLKKQPHSQNSLKSSEVKEIGGSVHCKARIEAGHSVNIDKFTENPEKSLGLTPDTHRTNGIETSSVVCDIQVENEARQETLSTLEVAQEKQRLSEGPQLESNRSKLEIDLMVPPTMPSSPERVSSPPLDSDTVVTKDYCKRDSSVKSIEKIIVQNEMIPDEVKWKKVEKHEWLNLDLEGLSQETGRDSSRLLQHFDWSQPQQAKSAQLSSVLPSPVAVGGWPIELPPQGYVPLIQNSKPVDGSNGYSSTLVQPRPKRCATHFSIARNIHLHQQFVKTNSLSQPNPSLQGRSPILSLNSEAQDRIAVNGSAPKDKASESGHFVSARYKKPQQPPPASSSILPAPAFIFSPNHHLQPVMVPSKSPRPAKNPCVAVGSASINFNHPSSSASEASSQYFTLLPNNAYSFQLSSSIRGVTPSQAMPLFNGSFYSPQMFQPPQLLQKQSQAQRLRQPQANVQKYRQQSQKSEAKAAGDLLDSRGSHTQKGGPSGQFMTAHVQPPNFSMSFASFAGAAAPANLNFSSNGYHIASTPPAVHQKIHQASDSNTGGGSCSGIAENLKRTLSGKPPAMMNGQTLVFDNPSRTLNFVSGTWPPAATTISGDPSMFAHDFKQRQQLSCRSKTMSHSQADFVPTTSSQLKNPATLSLTSCNSLNLKQFESHQQIRTHGQNQISFAAPSRSQGRSGGSSSAANSKLSNSKGLPSSPAPSSPAENSASGSTQKTSPVCGRNLPPIITSCPGHLSELKY